ncbi:hypothetical protein MNV49_006972 [Pseudohyphozyma bogoriensis]|nr:hypothetical protein MNV49_006972 [Pseudohyphozyma bogoriensis]
MASNFASLLEGRIPDLHERAPLPPLAAAAPSILLVLAFFFRVRSWLLLPFFALLALVCLVPPLIYTTENVGGDFGIGSNGVFLLLTAVDRLLLSHLERDFVPPRGAVPNGLGRIVWVHKLLANMRGAGWSFEVKNTPKASPLQRGKYLLSRIPRLIGFYLAVDILSTWQQQQPYFHRQIPLSSLSPLDRNIHLTLAGSMAVSALSLLYTITCMICVASGVWMPLECPDLFGSPKGAYSVQGFWGVTWHQSFRRVFTNPADHMSNLLRLPPHSLSRKILTLHTAFALSAVQHSFAMLAMNRTGRKTAIFFLVQPYAIVLEEVVKAVIGKERARRLRGVGYVWTVGWLLWSGEWFFDELVQAGMWTVDPAPFSVVKGLTTGKYWYG